MATIGATAALWIFAAPASAETADAVAGAATAAASSVPIEAVQPDTAATGPGAVETPADAGNSAAEPVAKVVEDDPSAAAPSTPPVRVPSRTAASEPSGGIGGDLVSTPSKAAAGATEAPTRIVHGTEQRASDLVESVARASAKATAPVAARSPQGSLLSRVADPIVEVARESKRAVLDPLLDSVTRAVVEDPLPLSTSTAPLLETYGGALPNSMPSSFELPAVGLPSHRHSFALDESGIGVLAEFGNARPMPGAARGSSSDRGGGPPLPGNVGAAHASPAFDHAYGDGPAAPGVPLPDPESPAGVAPGADGFSFVPFAALLALLALAAPATIRRRRSPPGFLVPAQFVCALERPG